MIRRTPRSTPTDTPFPYTTLFRFLYARVLQYRELLGPRLARGQQLRVDAAAIDQRRHPALRGQTRPAVLRQIGIEIEPVQIRAAHLFGLPIQQAGERRSAERRVGKEWVSTCRSRWSRYH